MVEAAKVAVYLGTWVRKMIVFAPEPLIQEGVYRQLLQEHLQVWAYLREGHGERLLVLNNFYGTPCEIQLPDGVINSASEQRLLISNYPDCPQRTATVALRPYESFVLHLKD